MKTVKKFLLAVIIAVMLGGTGHCATSNLNFTNTDLADYGSWATENNREMLVDTIADDLDAFYVNSDAINTETFVPIEAKVGLSFMNAFSHISYMLNHSLTRFIIVFIIVMFGYWLTLEAIAIMRAESKIEDKFQEILKKAVLITVWVAALSVNPAKFFEVVISPILFIATLISDVILDGAAEFIGTKMPDTCSAIKTYVEQNISQNNILGTSTATNIMCVPTRMSSFAYTAIGAGWDWVKYGIGNSGFIFICGLGLIGIFLYLLWQFAFIAFGVIADLFLAIIMLPFTAVSETLGKTTFKGIIGNIFNGFLGLFSTESLKKQIQRFIDAGLHFVVLSVIVVICMTLLSMATETGTFKQFPDIEDINFWVTLLLVGTTVYLAKNASKFANEIGGKINTDTGDKLKGFVNEAWSSSTKQAKSWWKILRKK